MPATYREHSQELYLEFDVFSVQIKSTLDHLVQIMRPILGLTLRRGNAPPAIVIRAMKIRNVGAHCPTNRLTCLLPIICIVADTAIELTAIHRNASEGSTPAVNQRWIRAAESLAHESCALPMHSPGPEFSKRGRNVDRYTVARRASIQDGPGRLEWSCTAARSASIQHGAGSSDTRVLDQHCRPPMRVLVSARIPTRRNNGSDTPACETATANAGMHVTSPDWEA